LFPYGNSKVAFKLFPFGGKLFSKYKNTKYKKKSNLVVNLIVLLYMCYSTPMSFSFAISGILTSYYIYFYNNFNYSYLPMLLLFYSTMEIVQGVQYYYVNQCSNTTNIVLTEFAYLLVLLQPLMWNFFYYKNSVSSEKNIFLTAMVLCVSWIIVNVMTRIFYNKKNDTYKKGNVVGVMKFEDSMFGGDSVCTKKQKTHLYWQWTSAKFYDLHPTMLMYVLVWFVPALISKKHRLTSLILILSFLIAGIVTYFTNEYFVFTSLWCYISVPIVLVVIYNIIKKQ